MKIHIGTSGYNYPGWQGVFYPEKMNTKQMFAYYMSKFNTVEINYSFYHTPTELTMKKWYEAAGIDFRYTLKAPRKITHVRKLNDSSDLIENFKNLALLLRGKCGVILFQMPPSFRMTKENMEKLEECFRVLGRELLYAFEFRHNSWYDSVEPAELCREYGIAFCIVSAPGIRFVNSDTAPHIYFRLHGKLSWYNYDYTNGELGDFAGIIQDCFKKDKEVWVYFNNDFYGYAVKNALTLKRFLKDV